MVQSSPLDQLVMSFEESDIPWPAGRDLYKLWSSKRGERRFPARSDLSPLEMKNWLPNIGLIDVIRDPLRFRVRLAGTNVGRMLDRDLTGTYVDELPDGEALVARYTWAVENGKPYFCSRIPLMFANMEYQAYSTITFPLGESDKQVNMLLGLIEFHKT